MLRVIPYSGSLFIERQGDKLVNPTGQAILEIVRPELFADIEEGVALTLAIRRRIPVVELDSKISQLSDRIRGLQQEMSRLQEQRDIAAATGE